MAVVLPNVHYYYSSWQKRWIISTFILIFRIFQTKYRTPWKHQKKEVLFFPRCIERDQWYEMGEWSTLTPTSVHIGLYFPPKSMQMSLSQLNCFHKSGAKRIFTNRNGEHGTKKLNFWSWISAKPEWKLN